MNGENASAWSAAVAPAQETMIVFQLSITCTQLWILEMKFHELKTLAALSHETA